MFVEESSARRYRRSARLNCASLLKGLQLPCAAVARNGGRVPGGRKSPFESHGRAAGGSVVQVSERLCIFHRTEDTNTGQIWVVFPPLAANLVQGVGRWQKTCDVGGGYIFKCIVVTTAFVPMFFKLTFLNTSWELERPGMDCSDVISASTLALECFWAVWMGALDSVHSWHEPQHSLGEI
jgi:hypothetical protein